MALDHRIAEIARQQKPPRAPMRGPAEAGEAPASSGVPLDSWSWWTNTGATNLVWDVTDFDTSVWCGRPETCLLWLNGSLTLRVGQNNLSSEADFTRASSSARTGEDGSSEAVEANVPCFDYLAGPNYSTSGVSRWLYRSDQVDALLTTATDRVFSRRQGAIACWVQPQTDAAAKRILWATGSWELARAVGTSNLVFTVPLLSGSTATCTYDMSGWAADSWHQVVATWSRPQGELTLWIDGVLAARTATTLRYALPGATMGIGQGTAAGLPWADHLVDFRVFPLPLTPVFVDALFRIKA